MARVVSTSTINVCKIIKGGQEAIVSCKHGSTLGARRVIEIMAEKQPDIVGGPIYVVKVCHERSVDRRRLPT